MVDVRVHAGERELDRGVGVAALLDQRPPRDRTRRAGHDRVLGIEVQPGEHDVEPIEEARSANVVLALALPTASVTWR